MRSHRPVYGVRLPNSIHRVRHSFLYDIRRIASRGYQPTEDDVVRARLRTMGVQEHRIMVEKGTRPNVIPICMIWGAHSRPGTEAGCEWLIYDVGGARSLVCHLLVHIPCHICFRPY